MTSLFLLVVGIGFAPKCSINKNGVWEDERSPIAKTERERERAIRGRFFKSGLRV